MPVRLIQWPFSGKASGWCEAHVGGPQVRPGSWIALGWCYQEGAWGANRPIGLLRPGQEEAPPQWTRSIDHSGDPATLSNMRMCSKGEAFAVIISNPARAGNSAVRNRLCRSATASLSGF